MSKRQDRAAAAPPLPPAPPERLTAYGEDLRRVSEVAYACLNAVADIAAQLDATAPSRPGEQVVDELPPEALRQTVGRLREAVMPANFSGFEQNLYARSEAVRIPGLKPTAEAKRAPVYATSYHAAVITLGCDLYRRLAEQGLAYWTAPNTRGRIDLREWFDDEGGIDITTIPVYRDLPVARWPKKLGRMMLAESRIAAPRVNAERLAVELALEKRAADLQLFRLREAATNGGKDKPDGRTADGTPDQEKSARRPKASPAVYVAIRDLHRVRGMTVAVIVRHLTTPDGRQVAELVDALLKKNPKARNGRKRLPKDVVRAALSGHYNSRPGK